MVCSGSQHVTPHPSFERPQLRLDELHARVKILRKRVVLFYHGPNQLRQRAGKRAVEDRIGLIFHATARRQQQHAPLTDILLQVLSHCAAQYIQGRSDDQPVGIKVRIGRDHIHSQSG